MAELLAEASRTQCPVKVQQASEATKPCRAGDDAEAAAAVAEVQIPSKFIFLAPDNRAGGQPATPKSQKER